DSLYKNILEAMQSKINKTVNILNYLTNKLSKKQLVYIDLLKNELKVFPKLLSEYLNKNFFNIENF
uniref:hypothetical protein n=1 Tax=Methanobrevibacter oralis TaxID=66851 RepID=UPI001C7362F4